MEDILKRIAALPEKMKMIEARVPMKVKDPETGRMMNDPHGRFQQTRLDVVDEADPLKKPIIHFHKYPDHPAYEGHWKEYAEAFIHMKSDIEFLIKELEGK